MLDGCHVSVCMCLFCAVVVVVDGENLVVCRYPAAVFFLTVYSQCYSIAKPSEAVMTVLYSLLYLNDFVDNVRATLLLRIHLHQQQVNGTETYN